MGEARRRRLAGTYPKIAPPYPDYGNALWDDGCRHTTLHVCFSGKAIVDDGPTRDLGGCFYTDDAAYCLTLRTEQTAKEILAHRTDGGMFWIEGHLSPTQDTGQSGEVYRVICGKVVPGS